MLRPALNSFADALDFLREQLDDVTPVQITAQPAGVANHPRGDEAWV
jgi:hypothetical protein